MRTSDGPENPGWSPSPVGFVRSRTADRASPHPKLTSPYPLQFGGVAPPDVREIRVLSGGVASWDAGTGRFLRFGGVSFSGAFKLTRACHSDLG